MSDAQEKAYSQAKLEQVSLQAVMEEIYMPL